MITKENEYLFNVILSLFFGIMFVIMSDKLFDSPRVITLYKNI